MKGLLLLLPLLLANCATGYHFRRKTAHYLRDSFIFAFLLLSNLHLQAYLIPEIVAKAKPAVVEIVGLDQNGTPTTPRHWVFYPSRWHRCYQLSCYSRS